MLSTQPIPASSGAETINLTPEGWQLYTTMRGVKAVAARLNQAFNSSTDETAIRTAVHQAMIKTCDFGSFDSEPREVLEVLLAKRFHDFDPDDYNGPPLRFEDGLTCGCTDCMSADVQGMVGE